MTTLPPAIDNQAGSPEDSSLQGVTPQEETIDPRLEQAKDFIKNIVREIDVQERPTREVMIKIWKYLDLLWTGIANFYWNSSTNQWSPITYDDIRHLSESADVDPTLMNKTVNMLRPYGESIVGVLTTTLPRNKYFPADADNVDDINTAKAYISIERKINRDNEMKTKIVQMIVKLLTGGFFAAYNYSHSSHKYGTYIKQGMINQKYRISSYICPECGQEILSTKDILDSNDQAQGVEKGESETINEGFEFQEQEEDRAELGEEEQAQASIEALECPCGELVNPLIEQSQIEEPAPNGSPEIIPRSRQVIEIYGPMEVKIPTHASKKEEVLWLILEDEVHESLMRTLYPQHRDQIKPGGHTDLAYDRWARSQYENMGELNQHYVTRRRVWLRPSAYEILGDLESPKVLRDLYPSGLMAVFSTDQFLFCEEADMDDCWTFSLNPIYNRLLGDPLLKSGIPLQEVANDLFQAEVETFKHSMPITFADPEALDFDEFAKTKNQPGIVFPMKGTVAGKAASDSFYQTAMATLPKEVEVLEAKIEKTFQFVLGVFPSVFGGPGAGTKTLGEYEQSRGQALQRLNINPWEVVNVAYAQMMGKSVKAYADSLLDDEVFVESKGNSFVNTWIRRDALGGRIGEVKPELSEQFPTTWGQKKAAWLELVGLNNDLITSILFHPENSGLISQILAIDDLYIPGDDQRNKQLEEIRELIQSAPLPPPPPQPGQLIDHTQEPMPISSVPVETVDDNNIHMAVLSAFICSSVGQAIKQENPTAYLNLMLHYQAHELDEQQKMVQQMMMQNAAQPTQNGPGNKNQKEAPSKQIKESK